MQEKRKEWKLNQVTLEVNNLIFIDESSINLGMPSLYGRAVKKERVVDYLPDVRFKRLSILSAVRLEGTHIPMVFSGTLNRQLFVKYVEDFLASSISKGDIVIMDNLSAHKVGDVAGPIPAKGASILYLAPYSPDLNPIELLWSKLKSFLKKAKARTYNSLIDAIKLAPEYITPDDISAWFKHDGYLIQSG